VGRPGTATRYMRSADASPATWHESHGSGKRSRSQGVQKGSSQKHHCWDPYLASHEAAETRNTTGRSTQRSTKAATSVARSILCGTRVELACSHLALGEDLGPVAPKLPHRVLEEQGHRPSVAQRLLDCLAALEFLRRDVPLVIRFSARRKRVGSLSGLAQARFERKGRGWGAGAILTLGL